MSCFSEIYKNGIDWSATGSMLSGVGSIVLWIFQGFINKGIRRIEQQNIDRDFKANIFSERYKIYNTLHLFCNSVMATCIEYSNSENEFDPTDFQDSVLQKIYNENSGYTGIILKNDYFQERELIRKLQDENVNEEINLKNLKKKCEELNSYNLKKLLFELNKSEFCFENQEIYKCIIKLNDRIFEKIDCENIDESENVEEGESENREYFNACEYVKNLQAAANTIDNKIFDEMKKELKMNK